MPILREVIESGKMPKTCASARSNSRHPPSFLTVDAPHYISAELLKRFSVFLSPRHSRFGAGFSHTVDFPLSQRAHCLVNLSLRTRNTTLSLLPPHHTHPSPNGITPFQHHERHHLTTSLEQYLKDIDYEGILRRLIRTTRLLRAAACDVKTRQRLQSNLNPTDPTQLN